MTTIYQQAIGIVAVGLTLSVGQAVAVESVATLAQIQGITLVNQGSDYVTATPGMPLRQGDRLMAMEGGSASIKFVDGCVLSLSDNTILTVGAADSCTKGQTASTQVGPYVAAAGAGGASAGLITAGVLAGVVILGATDAFPLGSDDDDPILPPSP